MSNYVWRICTNITPLNAELNPIRHLLALEGARHIAHVSRKRVKYHSSSVFICSFHNMSQLLMSLAYVLHDRFSVWSVCPPPGVGGWTFCRNFRNSMHELRFIKGYREHARIPWKSTHWLLYFRHDHKRISTRVFHIFARFGALFCVAVPHAMLSSRCELPKNWLSDSANKILTA